MGTRLASITKNKIPKSMVPVKGRPLLEWQIGELKKYGITEITMIIGNLGDQIREHFGDGSAFGIRADYIVEETPLGTAGAFYYLKDRLKQHGDTEFMLVFGDIFFDFDMERMIDFHHRKNAAVTLLAHPNMHPFDSDLVVTDPEGRVTGFDSKHNVRNYWYDNCVNAGIYVIDASVCGLVAEPVKTDFEHDVLAKMIEDAGNVYAYRTPEFVRDVGTVDRIEKTIGDIDSGLVAAKNLRKKQKAVFLDRDGVLNREVGFLSNIDDFELLPEAAEAVKLINSSGYLAVVVTNQPVVARGEITFEGLDEIFRKMKTLLGREGAYLDAVYFCPHHPDSGYEGEVKELKIKCHCRKPDTGMVEKAAEDFNIDPKASWIIGDMTSDIELGKRAGLKTMLVRTGYAGTDGRFEVQPDHTEENILTAVRKILENETREKQ